MNKIIYLLIMKILFSFSLYAKEPTMAILKEIVTNNIQKFGIGNYTFYCTPYGLLTLDDIYMSKSISSGCKKKVDEFFIQRPDLKYFTNLKMKREQMYRIEIKNQQCVIYVDGQRTLAESLLKAGLAVVKPTFRDEEFRSYFKKAQRIGKYHKNGIHKDNILRACLIDIYK